MAWYFHSAQGRLKQMDEAFFAQLVDDDNPKADGWVRIADPHSGQYWDGATWKTPKPAIPDVSDRQFFQQAAVAGIITPDEALAAVKVGAIPEPLQAIIDTISDENQKFVADMILSGATIFRRDHPMTDAISASFGWTPEQTDAFFLAASQL